MIRLILLIIIVGLIAVCGILNKKGYKFQNLVAPPVALLAASAILIITIKKSEPTETPPLN